MFRALALRLPFPIRFRRRHFERYDFVVTFGLDDEDDVSSVSPSSSDYEDDGPIVSPSSALKYAPAIET